MKEIIYELDWKILFFIEEHMSCKLLDFLMPKITMLGELGAIWIIFSIIMIVSKKYRKYGILMLIGMLAGVLIGNLMLKNIVARSRPCWIETVRLLIDNPSDYSFPSGHTLASVIGAFIMTAANRKFGLFAIPLAILIAFSRLYVCVHFPTDIIGAAVLGIVISIIILKYRNFILKPIYKFFPDIV